MNSQLGRSDDLGVMAQTVNPFAKSFLVESSIFSHGGMVRRNYSHCKLDYEGFRRSGSYASRAMIRLMGMKENFSENLRKFRKIRKLSQTQLAEMTGNELRTIQHYEAGERDFGLGKIETIANVLDISVADLLGIPGARPSPQEAWKIVGKALGVEIHPTVPVGMIEAMKDPRIRSMIEDVLDDTMPEWREVRHATR